MTLNQLIESISNFGSNILSPKEGEPIIEPFIEPSFNLAIESLEILQNGLSPLEVGIINLLPSLILPIWNQFSEDSKSKIIQNCERLFKIQFHPSATTRFSILCIEILNNLNNNWPQLINFIFTSSNYQIRPNLFIKLISISKSDFIDTNLENIRKLIIEFLQLKEISIQVSIIAILSNLDCNLFFEKYPNLLEILMESVLNIFSKEPERISFLTPILVDIFISSPIINKQSSDVIQKFISNCNDIQSISTILNFFPFLPNQDILLLIKQLVIVSNKYIIENNEINFELLNLIESSPIEDFNEETSKTICNYFLDSFK